MRFLLSVLLLWTGGAFAADVNSLNNLIPEGNFEIPFVKERTPWDQGGNPSVTGKPNPEWASFMFRNVGATPQVTGGLTNEVSKNGNQSLFVSFIHANRPFEAAVLTSNFIPVVSGTQYMASIWGRADAKDPIDPQGRSAYLKLEVDYFAKDGNESVGEPKYSVQPMPGSKGHPAFFVPDGWRQYYVQFTPPEGTIFVQVIWRCETGSDAGEVNGTMFFDDATLTGPSAPNPDMTPVPVQEETPAPDASGSPAAQ